MRVDRAGNGSGEAGEGICQVERASHQGGGGQATVALPHGCRLGLCCNRVNRNAQALLPDTNDMSTSDSRDTASYAVCL
jgi:hypothetical protein